VGHQKKEESIKPTISSHQDAIEELKVLDKINTDQEVLKGLASSPLNHFIYKKEEEAPKEERVQEEAQEERVHEERAQKERRLEKKRSTTAKIRLMPLMTQKTGIGMIESMKISPMASSVRRIIQGR